MRRSFLEDEQNTEQDVALVVKLAQGAADGAGRGIHWHVQSSESKRG